MTLLEFAYLSVGLAAWVFIILNIVVVIYIVKFIKSFKFVSGTVTNFLMNFLILKGGVKLGLFGAVSNILKSILGGVKNESRK